MRNTNANFILLVQILGLLNFASTHAWAQIPSLVGDDYNYEVASPAEEQTASMTPAKASSPAGAWFGPDCEYSAAFKTNFKHSVKFSPESHSFEKVLNLYQGKDGKTCNELTKIIVETYNYSLSPLAGKADTYLIKTTMLTRVATPVHTEVRVISEGEEDKPHPALKLPPSDTRLPERRIQYNLLKVQTGNLYWGLSNKQKDCSTVGSRPTQIDMKHPLTNTPGTN